MSDGVEVQTDSTYAVHTDSVEIVFRCWYGGREAFNLQGIFILLPLLHRIHMGREGMNPTLART